MWDLIWTYFDYWVNRVPWWLLPGIAGIALVVTWAYWGPIWKVLPGPVKTVILAVIGALTFYGIGRVKGREAEKRMDDLRQARAAEDKRRIEDEVKSLPDSGVDDRLRKSGWMRKRK